jgi:catechol 2,3-dioxygenase-like lactoylglutathione lyase family enzyme
MIDHFNLPVSDLERSLGFYRIALAPLGLRVLMRDGEAIGFGVDHWQFGIVAAKSPLLPLHVAFAAASPALVDRFFEQALAAGGVDNGAPGIRPHYDPRYYAAYVLDPDGHRIEAVCRRG